MIRFDISKNLNGFELVEELESAGIAIVEDDGRKTPIIDSQGLWLNIAESDEAKATPIVAAHNGTTIAPDNSADKAALLAKLGITADELKTLLN